MNNLNFIFFLVQNHLKIVKNSHLYPNIPIYCIQRSYFYYQVIKNLNNFSFFIREAAKLKSGSKEPGRSIVASITKKQAEEIAKQKMNILIL